MLSFFSQLRLRKYLSEYGLYFDSRTTEAPFVSQEQLDKFKIEGDSHGPKVGPGMVLEWTKKFESSEWNRYAFLVLSIDFHDKLIENIGDFSGTEYVDGITTRVWIEKAIKEKLRKKKCSGNQRPRSASEVVCCP